MVGMGSDGLPTVATCRWSTFLTFRTSKPQKVKKRVASMPLMRAALARMRPG
jgi:hypothetical protein